MKRTWYTHRKVAKEARKELERRSIKALLMECPDIPVDVALRLVRLILDQNPVL